MAQHMCMFPVCCSANFRLEIRQQDDNNTEWLIDCKLSLSVFISGWIVNRALLKFHYVILWLRTMHTINWKFHNAPFKLYTFNFTYTHLCLGIQIIRQVKFQQPCARLKSQSAPLGLACATGPCTGRAAEHATTEVETAHASRIWLGA